MEREVVFLMPGPIHLFWCTGVFYLWELGKQYQIVLLVSSDYAENLHFNMLSKCSFVEHIEYVHIRSSRIRNHFYYSSRFKALAKRYRPRFIFLHNWNYPDTLYLMHWVQRLEPRCQTFFFQSARMTFNSQYWREDFLAQQAMNIERFLKGRELGELLFWLASLAYKMRNGIRFWLDYKLMPLLTIGKVFRPIVNIYTGEFYQEEMEKFNQSSNVYLCAYLPVDINAYMEHGYKKIVQISCPIKQSAREVFEFLYGDLVNKEQILILPSHGFCSRLLAQGLSEKDVVDSISKKWCEAIDALRGKYPDYNFAMKSHPGAKENSTWLSIQNKITGHLPSIVILRATQSAEWHIVQSKVVVSDVSTVLWWAAFLCGKTVISLDIFGYPGGDQMKYYNDIHYINSLDQLRNIENSRHYDGLTSTQCPSLLDILKKEK